MLGIPYCTILYHCVCSVTLKNIFYSYFDILFEFISDDIIFYLKMLKICYCFQYTCILHGIKSQSCVNNVH